MHIPGWSFVLLIMLLSSGASLIKHRTMQICLRAMLIAVLIAGISGVLG
jgi:hypothetical protein